MSFLSSFGKKEVNIEDLCRDFYDNFILNPVVGGVDVTNVFPECLKETITEVEPEFNKIELEKLNNEIIILRFELYALAWIHKFGDKHAFTQSVFTKRYLKAKGRNDIWDGMEHYNEAISHATVKLENSNPSIIRKKFDLADIKIAEAKQKGITVDENIGRPINRMFSEKVWENGTITYFLTLALCHQLGLGSGPDYLGPKNDEAMLRFAVFINGLYEGAKQSWDKIKIKD